MPLSFSIGYYISRFPHATSWMKGFSAPKISLGTLCEIPVPLAVKNAIAQFWRTLISLSETSEFTTALQQEKLKSYQKQKTTILSNCGLEIRAIVIF